MSKTINCQREILRISRRTCRRAADTASTTTDTRLNETKKKKGFVTRVTNVVPLRDKSYGLRIDSGRLVKNKEIEKRDLPGNG